MATKISWCDETINPIIGCSKSSCGCANCYAEPMARRLAAMGTAGYGGVITDSLWSGRTAFVGSALDKPYGWKSPRSVFIGSMGDVFHESTPFNWIERVLGMVASNPQHTFIMLTKRAGRMQEFFKSTDMAGQLACLYQLAAGTDPETCQDDNWPLPNLVLGVSAENQAMANERIRVLLQTPAAKRFVSVEPMLGEVDLYRGGWSFLSPLVPPPGNKTGWKRGLDGVIVGGESGSTGRILNPQWVRLLRDQCKEAGVAFMFKQWGDNVLSENGRPWEFNFPNGFPDLDGKEHSALPWSVR